LVYFAIDQFDVYINKLTAFEVDKEDKWISLSAFIFICCPPAIFCSNQGIPISLIFVIVITGSEFNQLYTQVLCAGHQVII